jgi:hypothetical protein
MLTVVFGEVSGAAPIADSRRTDRSTSIVPESMNFPEQQIFFLKSEVLRTDGTRDGSFQSDEKICLEKSMR